MRVLKKIGKGFAIFLALCIVLMVLVPAAYYPYYKKHESVRHMETSTDEELTIMSFNIRCFDMLHDFGKKTWYYRADLVDNIIEDDNPDIFGVQEATRFHVGYLTRTLPDYTALNMYRDDTFLSEANTLFYKTERFDLVDNGNFWLSNTPEVSSKDWDSANCCVVTYAFLKDKVTEKTFGVFCLHFDHISVEARVNGAKVLIEQVRERAGDMPVILFGDYNRNETEETYDVLTDEYTDARTLFDPVDMTCTFQHYGTEEDTLPIDHFMISKTGVNVLSYEVDTTLYDGDYPSDHYPILIRCTIE